MNQPNILAMKTNLKPCPFCGGKAIFRETIFNWEYHNVYCADCECELESKDKYELIKRWNTRYDEMTLKKVLLIIPELAIKILALAVLASGVYWIFA